jgi:hypothetical protein
MLLGYTLGSWALGRTVAGWTSLSTIVLTVGSVQLLVLGILGEYVGRLYMESKGRPLFIIDAIYAPARPATRALNVVNNAPEVGGLRRK